MLLIQTANSTVLNMEIVEIVWEEIGEKCYNLVTIDYFLLYSAPVDDETNNLLFVIFVGHISSRFSTSLFTHTKCSTKSKPS